MYIERLGFDESQNYNAIEAAIHLGRYMSAKPLCKNKNVLDIACGEGYGSYTMVAYWEAKHVTGIDISEEAIESANQRFQHDNIDFILGDVEEATKEFADETFDLIVSYETIEHIQNTKGFLQTLKRLIKKDGVILVSCPNDHWYYPTAEESNPYHVQKYHFEDFKYLTESIFGEASSYFLGLPSSGFANILKESSLISTEKNSMNKMFDFDYPNALLLPAEINPDSDSCSYFLGVWDYSNSLELKNSIALYPSSMNHADYINSYKYRMKFEETQKELDESKQETNQLRLEHEKSILSKNGVLKENEFLRHNLWILQNQIQELQTSHEALKHDIFIKEQELNTMVNSKSWKITSPLRKIMNKARR